MKAQTKLNKQQQLITRAFLDVVLTDADKFGDNPGAARSAAGFCYHILGYQILSNGSAIPAGVEVKTGYGAVFSGNLYEEYPDQYVADGEALGKTANPFVSRARK